MHITVAGKQVETGEALKTHVREGLGHIARKYFDHAVEANVTFRRDRAFFACDINLKAGRNLFMLGEGEEAPRVAGQTVRVGNSIVHRIDRFLPPPPAE